ncbi:hypothetical protein [Deinococcus yavapaiensis]|uniref:Uncharacterized protein n=1 Tax=Deinococcus yavapaiensis KR-236 TaxID=694435 RepID=A0A318S667_9DEIO|nr:hypothetical protein [Deinococcus yavapaiensis]PYE54163.1 hypothetical protein DES52_106128 [Deinococcus yavapaiensis KR-236]
MSRPFLLLRLVFPSLVALAGMVQGTTLAAPNHLDVFLQPMQLWKITATPAEGKPMTYTIEIAKTPMRQTDTYVAYNHANGRVESKVKDEEGDLVPFTEMWSARYDVKTEYPEWLEFDYKTIYMYFDIKMYVCGINDPSAQKNTEKLNGYFTDDADLLEAYIKTGATNGMGTCTAERVK